MLYIAGAIAIAAVAFLIVNQTGKAKSQDVHQLVANGALLLDVRTPGEFGSGHLDGAKNIPVGQLPQRIGDVDRDKDEDIVVYCRSGGRSSRAKRILEKEGFTAVHDLGAMSRW